MVVNQPSGLKAGPDSSEPDLVQDSQNTDTAYQGLGFIIQPGGEHPGLGTRNAAWRIDVKYIELITVHDARSRVPASARCGPRSRPPCAPVAARWRSLCWSPTSRRP